mmetsp:Transcript_59871/g.66924  ORF Transcript_59871/g.66924 Transcript_59871/m.66924 type:complete len:140 (-) Transcript_59871:104-523(-)
MLEVSISIVAWISVVVIQACVHYFVFGARKERMIQETDAVLEESFSFTTNESSMEIELDPATSVPNTPTSAPFAPSYSISTLSSIKNPLSSTESTVYLQRCNSTSYEESQIYLMQTGSEMLKSCSLESRVEEQIRAVPE